MGLQCREPVDSTSAAALLPLSSSLSWRLHLHQRSALFLLCILRAPPDAPVHSRWDPSVSPPDTPGMPTAGVRPEPLPPVHLTARVGPLP